MCTLGIALVQLSIASGGTPSSVRWNCRLPWTDLDINWEWNVAAAGGRCAAEEAAESGHGAVWSLGSTGVEPALGAGGGKRRAFCSCWKGANRNRGA